MNTHGALPSSYLVDVKEMLLHLHNLDRSVTGRRARSPITLLPGLSEAEILRLELAAGGSLPLDVRSFLQAMVPQRGTDFPNWKVDPEGEIKRSYAIIERGFLFSIEHNGYWRATWGKKPGSKVDAVSSAMALLNRAPPLLRIYSHRYIPLHPSESCNPIFSIAGTDIYQYGLDLVDYFYREFNVPLPSWWKAHSPREIRFWSSMTHP